MACAIGASSGIAFSNPAEARRMLDDGAFESARDLYQQLADQSRSTDRRAALRLGQGLSAYRAEDYRGARAGYSDALLSSDTTVRQSAHHGLGNSLFQLGWIGLADAPYPADPQGTPDLDAFDRIARERIAKMLDAPEPESGETDGYVRIRNTVLNWSDAARHYQSALELDPANDGVLANRRTTMVFLERLHEILMEERDETEQSIPMPSPGEGEPQPQPQSGEEEQEPQPGESGESEKNEPQESENGDSPEDSESQGEQGEPDGESQEQQPEKDDPTSDEEGQEREPADPNETPEERARRILSENADVETGPLNPGRREFIPPAKDW